MSEYILKHRNEDVLEFNIDKESNNVDYINILDSKFSPLNTKSSEISKIVSFNSWLIGRSIPDSRDGVERLRKKYNVNNLKDIMIAKYGLSLSDHYWIERHPFKKKWEDINLFNNRYSEIIGSFIFDRKIKLVNDINDYFYDPNTSTGGKLRKYWKYDNKNNINYLVKGGSSIYKQEPFNEYFASLLLKELKFKNTEYIIKKYDNNWVSLCKCIADNNIEMISANDICRKYGIARTYESLINIGESKHCSNFKDDINRMIICDYIIENTDRHWSNFGVLRDSNTSSWISVIPIFDNGYSLWNNDFVDNSKSSQSLSFDETNDDCMKLVKINDYIEKLPDIVDIFEKAFDKYENKERKDSLRKGIEIKQKEIRNKFEIINYNKNNW